MDSLPSANLRQQKLEQQRQLLEQKQKQKRQQQVGSIINLHEEKTLSKAALGNLKSEVSEKERGRQARGVIIELALDRVASGGEGP